MGVAVAPGNRDELAGALAQAAAAGTTVRPRGGGTHSRCGPAGPSADATLATTALGRLVEYTPQDLTITVEAGMSAGRLAEIAAAEGQFWPQAPTGPDATVGGVLAAAASTLSRLRFGPVRDSVLEVVVATGDGRLVTAGGRTVKGVSGYDLPRLMVGSLGSLGVIVEATLKLWPLPPARAWFAAEAPPENALRRGAELLDAVYRPGALVVTDTGVWAELVGEPDDVRPPEGLHAAEAPVAPAGAGRMTAGVSPGAIGQLVHALASLELPFAAQLGVGVCEVGVQSVDHVDAVRAAAAGLGGHAIVADAPDELRARPWGPPPEGLEIMRRLKAAFDPGGVLCPGLMPGEI
jgi:glycolate oxidase FAD binding subunit